MPHRDVYIIRANLTISTAITAIQLKAGTSYGFEILEATATMQGSTVSQQERICLVRKSVAATVTAATIEPVGNLNGVYLLDPGGPNPNLSLGTAATGFTGTAEGTDAGNPLQLGFNVLNGAYELPVPERRIFCRVSDIIALKFFTAPQSQLWTFHMAIQEF